MEHGERDANMDEPRGIIGGGVIDECGHVTTWQVPSNLTEADLMKIMREVWALLDGKDDEDA